MVYHRGTKFTFHNLCDCVSVGGSFDINIEADTNGASECSGVDAPSIGMFGLHYITLHYIKVI